MNGTNIYLRDASTEQLAEEAQKRGWRLIPIWLLATIAGGTATGCWTTPERTMEQ